MASSVRFRLATTRHIAAVLELRSRYYAEEGYPLTESESRAQLTRFLSHPEWGALWVAQSVDAVVGYLVVTFGFSFEYGGRDAFVDELYLAEGSRGQGLGSQAMELAETYCRERGVVALHLEVERHRTGAARLYERFGYRDGGRRLMSKRL